MATVILSAPSTLSNWTAICPNDSQGCQTFPRSATCSFATATSSLLTVAAITQTIANNHVGCRRHSIHSGMMPRHETA
jgi:hypothetical protein